ncbi:MAG: dCMP deaminase family protein [candidate division Zixibacteria bacterium]|nr:dCMP deaminase family protein [candidate division Zixibacteria bacterium]
MEKTTTVDKKSRRDGYLGWDEYFMSLAILSAMRSKDPNTQVGACIVNEENRIVGIGYNGFPAGCSDEELPWGRKGDYLDTKYPYVCHAEMNAILNSSFGRMNNCRMYVSLFPCNECAKLIIQAGIKQVVYLSDKYPNDEKFVAAKRMFRLAGVLLKPLPSPKENIVLDFKQYL